VEGREGTDLQDESQQPHHGARLGGQQVQHGGHLPVHLLPRHRLVLGGGEQPVLQQGRRHRLEVHLPDQVGPHLLQLQHLLGLHRILWKREKSR
jgi:hypothetical protein